MSEELLLKKLEGISAYVLKAEGYPKLYAEITFVGPTEIKRINKKFRGKNKVTDVLSFRELDDRVPFPGERFLGEILLCRSYIRAQAKSYGVAYLDELYRMTIHGTLHLLNYDHIEPKDAEIMLPLQEKYLKKFFK